MSSQEKKTPWLKRVIDFVLGLLTILKWVPFLGKYRTALIALSTVLGALSGMLGKCSTESDRQSTPREPIQVTPSPEPTPTRTPSPTPQPPRILFEKSPVVGVPFKVRYTAPFSYNYSLWVDTFRLQLLGKEFGTGYFVAHAITLNTGGNRTFVIKDEGGEIVAQKTIEVTYGSGLNNQ